MPAINCVYIWSKEEPTQDVVDVVSTQMDALGVYVRFKNPTSNLNALVYYYKEDADHHLKIKITDEHQLKKLDKLFEWGAFSRILTQLELFQLYQVTGHIHVIPEVNDKLKVLLRSSSNPLTPYEEVILQINERRMLARPPQEIPSLHQFMEHPIIRMPDEQRVFRKACVLIDKAINMNNTNALNRALLTVTYQDRPLPALNLMNEAVRRCIAKDKRHLLVMVFQSILNHLRIADPSYQLHLRYFSNLSIAIDCDEVKVARVVPLFHILGQFYSRMLKLRSHINDLAYHWLSLIQTDIEAAFIQFFIQICKPSVCDEPLASEPFSCHAFATHCSSSITFSKRQIDQYGIENLDELLYPLAYFFSRLAQPFQNALPSVSFFTSDKFCTVEAEKLKSFIGEVRNGCHMA